jgi:hypothetical protein
MPSTKLPNPKRVELVMGAGRRIFPSATTANDFRHREPLELQRGMQRPSDSALRILVFAFLRKVRRDGIALLHAPYTEITTT